MLVKKHLTTRTGGISGELSSIAVTGTIGPLRLKNRAVMVPMATDLADRHGVVTDRQIRYYQERAKGGVGMIIEEYTGVDDIDSILSIHNLRIARASCPEMKTDRCRPYV